MKTNIFPRGVHSAVLVVVGLVVVIGIASAWYNFARTSPQETTSITTEPFVVGPDSVLEVPSDAPKPATVSEADKTFQGTQLAGTTSPLLDFNKADYDKALASDKLVVFYFYASWCPICRAEFPKAQAAFNDLKSDNVVGFRVNFNDDETDKDEEGLAREFGVAYQHTKVFVKNGKRILKSPEVWEASRYLSEINDALK